MKRYLIGFALALFAEIALITAFAPAFWLWLYVAAYCAVVPRCM
jgi:hypothetical protein